MTVSEGIQHYVNWHRTALTELLRLHTYNKMDLHTYNQFYNTMIMKCYHINIIQRYINCSQIYIKCIKNILSEYCVSHSGCDLGELSLW